MHRFRLPLAACCPVALAALLLLTATPALRAEEVASPAAALLERLAALHKAGDTGSIEAAIEEVPAVHNGDIAAADKAKLLGLLGKIAKDKKMGGARATAVRTLAELDDPKGAWKEASKLMPTAKVEEASDLDLEVVRTAGKLAQSKASKPLLELVKKAKDPKLAAAAAKALGGFQADVKGRVKILEELISLGRRLRPGQSTDKAAGSAATERWGLVGPAIAEGLNGLTGRSEGNFEAWETLYDENKKKLKDLFPAE